MKKCSRLLLCVLAIAGCGGGGEDGAISRERFIAANVAIRAIPDTLPAVDSLRAAALREQGLTADDLKRFVAAHEGEVAFLAATWREIADEVEEVQRGSAPGIPETAEEPAPPAGEDGAATPPPELRRESPRAGPPPVRPELGERRSPRMEEVH